MRLPSRMIDLSSPLDNETVFDPPFMRPKIEYRTNAETAPLLCELFPGLRRQDLPDGEGWAIEQIALTNHFRVIRFLFRIACASAGGDGESCTWRFSYGFSLGSG